MKTKLVLLLVAVAFIVVPLTASNVTYQDGYDQVSKLAERYANGVTGVDHSGWFANTDGASILASLSLYRQTILLEKQNELLSDQNALLAERNLLTKRQMLGWNNFTCSNDDRTLVVPCSIANPKEDWNIEIGEW